MEKRYFEDENGIITAIDADDIKRGCEGDVYALTHAKWAEYCEDNEISVDTDDAPQLEEACREYGDSLSESYYRDGSVYFGGDPESAADYRAIWYSSASGYDDLATDLDDIREMLGLDGWETEQYHCYWDGSNHRAVCVAGEIHDFAPDKMKVIWDGEFRDEDRQIIMSDDGDVLAYRHTYRYEGSFPQYKLIEGVSRDDFEEDDDENSSWIDSLFYF